MIEISFRVRVTLHKAMILQGIQAAFKKAVLSWIVIGGSLSDFIEKLGWWRREQVLPRFHSM